MDIRFLSRMTVTAQYRSVIYFFMFSTYLGYFWLGAWERWFLGAFLLLAVPLFFLRGSEKRYSFPVLILVGVVAIQIFSWLHASQAGIDPSSEYPRLDVLGKLFVFIFIAWVLFYKKIDGGVYYFLFASVAGVIFNPFFHAESVQQVREFYDFFPHMGGARFDFGFRNAEHLGMLSGFSIIALSAFYRRLVFVGGKVSSLRLVGYAAIYFMSLFLLFSSQTRAAFLAMFVVILTVGVFYSIRFFRSQPTGKMVVAFFLFSLVFSFIFGLVAWKVWSDRAKEDAATISQISNLDFKNVPETSIGIRINLWKQLPKAFLDHPLLGMGQNGTQLVITHSKLPGSIKNNFGHFHNSIFDTVIRYGLIGLFLLIALSIWFFYWFYRAWMAGIVPDDVFYFSGFFSLFFFIVNQFESYIYYSSGAFVVNVVASVMLYYIFVFQSVSVDHVFASRSLLSEKAQKFQ